jgi:hypothetical protein
MNEFMLIIRNTLDHQVAWSSEQHRQFLEKCRVYIVHLREAGHLLSAQPLVREGVLLSKTNAGWQEAPFNENKEVLVGYYHILAKDLNEAVALAKGNPEFEFGTTARIEVRPIKVKEMSTGFVYPEKVA